MEKAILKTLIYADIFDYPMKAWEIHKWLIGKRATFQQVAKALQKLNKKGKVKSKKEYFFLLGRENLIRIRIQREKQSKRYLWKAKFFVWFLKTIPTIKLIGISGGLALNNATKLDDIDLFLVTAKNRMWLSRIWANLILDFLGIRRKAKMKKETVAGKICINILIEEDMLEQVYKDLFVAHEVLQMKVVWQRDNTYKKYLEINNWAFKFLPNWTVNQYQASSSKYHVSKSKTLNTMLNLFENWSRKLQLWYMKKPQGMERIQDGALYFHPNDIRNPILKAYKSRLKSSTS